MKNSDLFLELFDDDLLKPGEETALKTIPDNVEIPETTAKASNPSSSNSTFRTEFDICAALDNEKLKDELKNKKPIDKGKNDVCKEKSLIHSGDTDSSDDEDNKYMDSYNYNEFGRDVKRMLAVNNKKETFREIDEDEVKSIFGSNKPKPKIQTKLPTSAQATTKLPTSAQATTKLPSSNQSSTKQMSLPDKSVVKAFDPYADPYFGIRIVTPLISSQGIQIRMSGKAAVPLAKLSSHLAKKVEADFVTAGVIVRSVTKQSQNDNQYMIWEISDLKDDLPSITVFIFGNCYKDLWKTQVGTVVAILNPTGGNKKNNTGSDSFSISVKFSDQVMIWGQSKDYGTCKSLKKNGEKCMAFVNKYRCEFCIYHVKKEYSKFSSSRSEIQSPMGGGNMNFLRNKVLGKNEVFYGGKSFTALKAPSEKAKEKAKKLNPKDQQRLSNLGVTVLESRVDNKSNSVSIPLAPRAAKVLRTLNMDSHILKSLSSPTTNKPNSSFSKTIQSQNKHLMNNPLNQTPKLTNPTLDKNLPILSNPELESSLHNPSKQEISNNIGKLNKSLISKDKLKIPCLSNPEKDVKSTANENSLSSRSRHLFEEAISKKDSPKSSAKKKTKKPSLSNPEININKPPLKKELFPVSDTQLNHGKGPTLSDPTADFDVKSKNNFQISDGKDFGKDKDLQSTFKSLLSIASGQKKKSVFVEINQDSECRKANQEDMNIVREKTTDFDSSNSAVTSRGVNENSCSSLSSQNTPSSSKGELASLYQSNSMYRSPSSAAAKMSKAKARALMFVKQNGPINKSDPNSVKRTPESSSKKRERSNSTEGNGDGKMVFSELYLQLMKQTSQQLDFVEAERLKAEEEYFEKMGLKEQLEEKMLNTFKIDCKAVKCIECKYIWFSAADKCKAERHTLKIVDTVKRFFKCGNCSNRTVSLHVVPMFSCKNCSSSNWQRAPMMREKIVKVDNQLSIRGGEQQFINSQITNCNLNLLVPD